MPVPGPDNFAPRRMLKVMSAPLTLLAPGYKNLIRDDAKFIGRGVVVTMKGKDFLVRKKMGQGFFTPRKKNIGLRLFCRREMMGKGLFRRKVMRGQELLLKRKEEENRRWEKTMHFLTSEKDGARTFVA